ncbi:Hypothetical Protein FCC1311_019912 [Hondaea fermentalgiana]|uniref:Uncharacterized protein n=1 Tax=Hondaea fermentalgiana TaxID=2315210 RepID=A0A2R5G419_9STRA|nr:Hypothetical Protein FCC1311_019912 [Hondaea fermentalgiana]|eukprot:GBG25772.1 Hypothetical Protein FCC1311_019912 [Hondaea fermentalgiana]
MGAEQDHHHQHAHVHQQYHYHPLSHHRRQDSTSSTASGASAGSTSTCVSGEYTRFGVNNNASTCSTSSSTDCNNRSCGITSNTPRANDEAVDRDDFWEMLLDVPVGQQSKEFDGDAHDLSIPNPPPATSIKPDAHDYDLVAWLQELNEDGSFFFADEETAPTTNTHHLNNNNNNIHSSSAPQMKRHAQFKQVKLENESIPMYANAPALAPANVDAPVKLETHKHNSTASTGGRVRRSHEPVNKGSTVDMYSEVPTPVASPAPSWSSDSGRKRPRQENSQTQRISLPKLSHSASASSLPSAASSPTASVASSSKPTKITAMSIFMKHVRFTDDGIDASGIISRACFEDWLQSREKMPLRPEECYRKSLLCHLTCSDGGSCPFTPEVEAAVLQLLRKSGQIWPAFQNRVNAEGRIINIGIKGLRCLGFHERKLQPGDSSLDAAKIRRKSKARAKGKSKRFAASPTCHP